MDNDKRKMRHRHINIANVRNEYVHRIPDGKEKQMKWTYGNINQVFQHELKLISTNTHYISVNSLDAMRTTISHALGGDDKFFYMRIYPYPHQLLREHGLLGVAKAERISKGMKRSFGKTQSKVALVHPDQTIISLKVDEPLLKLARYALDIASKKLACASVVVESNVS